MSRKFVFFFKNMKCGYRYCVSAGKPNGNVVIKLGKFFGLIQTIVVCGIGFLCVNETKKKTGDKFIKQISLILLHPWIE